MKKIVLYCVLALMVVGSLTGCGKKDSNDKTFTVKCTTEKDTSVGFENQTVVIYNFDKNQFVTGYTSETTQKFDDKEVYEEYKSAQEETVNDTTDEDIIYSLKADDDNMTLVFTMTLKNLGIESAETEEEKNSLKASTILKNNEELNATCTVDGIDKSKIK